MPETFNCSDCHLDKPVNHEGGTGYATLADGSKICYLCCAHRDRAQLVTAGNSHALPLYLANGKVTNWPGSLAFPIHTLRTVSHNIAGSRTDAWFDGPDGHVWHGVQYGEWTQIIHCRRTREILRAVAHC